MGTACGLPPPVSTNVTSALSAPFNCGVKTTFTVHVPPAANVDGLIGQLLVSEKLVTRDPVILILENAIEVVPLFVTVMACGGDEVFSVTVPKLRLVGERLTTVPVPVSATFCGLLGALSAMFKVPVRVPALVGAKTTLMVQSAASARLVGQLFV